MVRIVMVTIALIPIVSAKGVISWKQLTFPGVARSRMKGWSCWQRAVRNSNISSAKDANRYSVWSVYTNIRLMHSCCWKTCGELWLDLFIGCIALIVPVHSFIHSFVSNIYIVPLEENYSEALPAPDSRNSEWRPFQDQFIMCIIL